METIIAPSILAADFGRMAEEVTAVTSAGADWVHLDVMDGHFVPPITFGPALVKAIDGVCSAPLDVHLMIEQPEQQLEAFREAGADSITVHYETCPHLHRTLQSIRELGARAGVAINPGTSVELLEPLIGEVDLILVMTVNPGWGGQAFISNSLTRIAKAREMIDASGRNIDLEVDGGINAETAKAVRKAGANVLVAGTYVFGSKDYAAAVSSLKA